jgi:hypothetical protein
MSLGTATLALLLAAAPGGPVAPHERRIDDDAALAEPREPALGRAIDLDAFRDLPAPRQGHTFVIEAAQPAPLLPGEPPSVGCRGLSPACERLTILGTVGAGVGLAAIASAVALLLPPDRPIPGEPAYLRSTRDAGVPLLAIGASVALGSVLLLLTAARSAKKRRLPDLLVRAR